MHPNQGRKRERMKVSLLGLSLHRIQEIQGCAEK